MPSGGLKHSLPSLQVSLSPLTSKHQKMWPRSHMQQHWALQTEAPSAPSPALLPPPLPEQALGLFPAGLSDGATDTSVLAALSLHQQPAAPMKFPRLCCSQLLPSAHSSKPQNGTNPMWSNASLVSVFFQRTERKGYAGGYLWACQACCSLQKVLSGFLPHWGRDGASAGEGQLRLWGLSCQPRGISSILTGMVASHRATPAASLAPALTGYKSGSFLSRKGLGTHVLLLPWAQPWHPSNFLQDTRTQVWILPCQFIFPLPWIVECLLLALVLSVKCHT